MQKSIFKNMKKGITATSLVFYIVGLVTIVGIIGGISVFATLNLNKMKEESQGEYNQGKVDLLIKSFLDRDFEYEIIKSDNPMLAYYQKIRFFRKENGKVEEHILRFKTDIDTKSKILNASSTNNVENTGYIFLDDILIASDVLGFQINEIEDIKYKLGKVLNVNIYILSENQRKEYKHMYGVLYDGNYTQ